MTKAPLTANPMETAPKDGTMLRLLVDYSDGYGCPLEDEPQAWTIGFNQLDDTGIDQWEMAGWNWEQDCFTEGRGTPIAWLPFHATPATEAEAFDRADYYWRTMDPDDSGDTPEEAISRAMLGRFCVVEMASSYRGPKRYGFVAPTLDPENDDEEFVHFATLEEAMAAATHRAAIARGQDRDENEN